MGLFQKREVPITTPMYSMGHHDTVLIVGLGNIGKKYELTRHNLGFYCVDQFAENEEFNGWQDKPDLKSLLCAKIIDGKKVILCKPTTMMNLSGDAVSKLQKYYKISPENTCVINDELSLNYGHIRSGIFTSSAGHNGVESIISVCGNNFWRIRVGIGPKQPEQIDTADFVLQKLSAEQLKAIKSIATETSSMINQWLSGNLTSETRTVST